MDIPPHHIRAFFTLIQCIHHISILKKQVAGQVTQAFSRKQKHLNDFIKPAFSGPKIKREIDEINKSWVTNISSKLVEHYESSIEIILSKISELSLSPPDQSKSMTIALQQARSHFGKKLQASTVKTFQNYFPNSTSTPADKQTLQPTPQTQSLPKQNTRKVYGHKDPLSNFFPCTINFRGYVFQSLEHAYQYHKALFHDCQHLAHQILRAPHAGIAKRMGAEIPSTGSAWRLKRWTAMRDLLNIKFIACKSFRDALLSIPDDVHISHDVPDIYWGVGKRGDGRDSLGALLSSLRTLHSRKTKPHQSNTKQNTPPPPSRPSSPSSSFRSPPPTWRSPSPIRSSPSLSVSNRFSPLANPEDWPLPSSIPSPKRSHVSATPKRTRSPPSPSDPSPSGHEPKGKRSRFTSPKSSVKSSVPITPLYHKGPKMLWSFPSLTKPVAVLGSSNVNRITLSPVSDIEVHSYPGANFSNFRKILSNFSGTVTSKSVILSLGINDRTAKDPKTTAAQLRAMVSNATRAFPNSHIYVPKLNFSSSLSHSDQQRLLEINQLLDSFSFQRVTVLEPLEATKFKTGKDNIHWTTETANAMLRHWISHLN